MSRVKWVWRLMVVGTVVAIGFTTAAYGSATKTVSSKGAAVSAGGSANTLNISDEYGVTWTCQFNPYNASDEFDSFGPVYEELVYQDALENGKATPWLATKWAWSNKDETLTFTIRHGVTWSDGQAFSAKDVLYHLRPFEEEPGARLELGLVSAEERNSQGI